jgi:predicted metalloendopeptidase
MIGLIDHVIVICQIPTQVIYDMLDRVSKSVTSIINETAWMDDATRAAALTKAEMIKKNVAYPDKWDNMNIPISGQLQSDMLHVGDDLLDQ